MTTTTDTFTNGTTVDGVLLQFSKDLHCEVYFTCDGGEDSYDAYDLIMAAEVAQMLMDDGCNVTRIEINPKGR